MKERKNGVLYMRMIVCCLLAALLLVACSSRDERRESFFRNSLELEKSGRIAEAQVEARNALKLDPNFAGAYLVLARCAVKDQNWREAYGNYLRATELDAKNAEARLGVGRIYLMSGDTAKALEQAESVLRDDAGSVDARMLRAGAQLKAGRHAEAQTEFQDVLRQDPKNDDARVALSLVFAGQGDKRRALDVIREGLVQDGQNKMLLFRAAGLAGELGDFGASERYLQSLSQLDAQNPKILLALASLYERMGEQGKVEAMLTEALAKDPKSEDVRLLACEYYLRISRPEKALEVLRSAPDGLTPKLGLAVARVLLATGRTAEAEAELVRIAEDTKAGLVGLDAKLLLSEVKLGRGDRAGALKDVDELLKLNGTLSKAHAARGRILMSLSRFEEALAELRIALKDAPDDAGLVLLAARCQLAMGNNLSAVESLKAYLDKKPDAKAVRLELAAYHQRLNQSDNALKVLAGGESKGQMEPEFLLAMGDIEVRRGKTDEALRLYRRAGTTAQAAVPAGLRVATVQLAAKDWAAAQKTCEDLLLAHADVHAAAEGVVTALFESGRQQDALAWARARMKNRPSDPLAADLAGRTAVRLKKFDEAEAAFRDSMQRAPQWTVPSGRLARLYAVTGKEAEALERSRQAYAKNPDALSEALLLGHLLQGKGQAAEAESLYREVLKRRPDYQPAANDLAYLIASDKTASAERLSEGLAFAKTGSASGDPSAFDTLGLIQYRLGDRQAARMSLQRAYEALPNDATVGFHYARVLADDGQNAQAKEVLMPLLEKGESFPEQELAAELLKRL